MSADIIKQTFIQKCLLEYMRMVEAHMRQAAIRNKVGVTQEGINSITYKAIQSAGGAMAQLSFAEYLRFVDMGAGRTHPLGGLRNMEVTLQASRQKGLAQVKDRVRKPKKIYASVAYGKLGWLYGKLLYGFGTETMAAIKAELENNQTTNNAT